VSKNQLIIFSRFPSPGKAKTRLIPHLGKEKAALIHRELAEYTLHLVEGVKSKADLTPSPSVQISYQGESLEQFRQWLGDKHFYIEQPEGTLGEKLARTFQSALNEGASRVLIIGTDCPELTDSILNNAFFELETKDLVLGPANDGGYYLIGLSSYYEELFQGIPWGGERVFAKTKQIADELHISTAILPTLNDIDRPEDLHIWDKIKRQQSAN